MQYSNYFLFLLLFFSACQPAVPEEAVEAEVPLATAKSASLVDSNTIVDFAFSLDYLTGRFEPSEHEDFSKIASSYADRSSLYLRKDTYEAFKKMHAAAKEAGIQLTIRSATRNFQSQKGIWEAKWTGQRILSDGKNAQRDYPDPKERALKILEYSSMPGTSRHHWGTDIDLNAFNNRYFASGEGLKVYEWLQANAHQYGFCQPYTAKGALRPNGYNEEKWHWSYLPVATQLSDQAQAQLKDSEITGFKGAETAAAIEVVKNYVLGINTECL